MQTTPKEILDFWFSPRISSQWFSATPELDREIKTKYEMLWQQAMENKLDTWRNDAQGCLALVIILDQFPLNMFRGEAKSFSSERQAVEVAWHAVKNHYDQYLDKDKLAFLFMPFMHSEFLAEQELSVSLYRDNHLEANLHFAKHHRDIVKRFGRFPHRNKILGRESTEEEIAWLASPEGYQG